MMFEDVKLYVSDEEQLEKVRVRVLKDGETIRRVVLVPGCVCRVEPLNPRVKKHRGRECVFVGEGRDGKAKVKFTDTQHMGQVEYGALVPVGMSTDRPGKKKEPGKGNGSDSPRDA